MCVCACVRVGGWVVAIVVLAEFSLTMKVPCLKTVIEKLVISFTQTNHADVSVSVL